MRNTRGRGRGRSGGRGRGGRGRRRIRAGSGGRGDGESHPMWAMVGDKVEVRSDEEGFIGAWYAAEVVYLESPSSCVVEYEQLLYDNGFPLQEVVLLHNLRPRPPVLPARSSWLQGHLVEAYDRDGWWAGIVVRSIPEQGLVLVRFRTTGEELTFVPSLLRGLQNWDNGIWTDLTQVGRPDDDDDFVDVVDVNGSSSPPHYANTYKRGYPRKGKLSSMELPSRLPEGMNQMVDSEQCDGPISFSGPIVEASSNRLPGCEPPAGTEEPQIPTSTSDHLTSVLEALKSKIRLELIAYQLLVKALRLKGPLNWSQELLLADVRLHLNITNAEQTFLLKGFRPSNDGRG